MMKILTSNARNNKASDTLAEQDRVALYRLAPIRNYRKSENILPGRERSDSFFEVVEGQVQAFGVSEAPFGTPLIFSKGDIISPIAPAIGVTFWIQALQPSTILEITPTVLANMSEKLQTWVYKNALASYERSARHLRALSRDVEHKNRLLAQRSDYELSRLRDVTTAPVIQEFIRQLPKLPAFATDLAVKLLDENVCVQEVAESIKQDPALAGIVLRRVNSAQYGFDKRIDSFYHACMILGLNDIYRLLVEEGMRQAIRKTPEAQKHHAHSCLISCLCYEISRLSDGVLPQSATTIGLMHDVGRSVVTLLVEEHPEIAPFASILDTAKIGCDLVGAWGLPPRIGDAIQFQNYPEFTPPDTINQVYRKEVAILHLAHAFESFLTGDQIDAARFPFVNECCEVLKIAPANARDVFQSKILPSLVKSRRRLPPEVRSFIPGQ
jgi:HD-like signal output (HDOD) protein